MSVGWRGVGLRADTPKRQKTALRDFPLKGTRNRAADGGGKEGSADMLSGPAMRELMRLRAVACLFLVATALSAGYHGPALLCDWLSSHDRASLTPEHGSGKGRGDSHGYGQSDGSGNARRLGLR